MIDLRSDTVSKPSPEMLTAMSRAEVGDDVYAEDPTVRSLEHEVAGLLGQEAALFTVTGSLANLLGVRALVAPGTELLCESSAHVARAELGAQSVVAGVTTRTWTGTRGGIDLEAVRGLLAPDLGPFLVRTAAVSVENTHNFGGGSVQSKSSYDALADLLVGAGVALHLDGARLWNASVATGLAPAAYARRAAAVSVCLSKGLGAPVGSLVAGPAALIAEARVWRKRFGAGWRQAGVLAAAGLFALRNNIERLAEDHANARLIAEILADAAPGTVKPDQVETNIVVLDLTSTGHTAVPIIEAAKSAGILIGGTGTHALRLVTHLDVPTTDCRTAAETLSRLLT